MLPFILLALYAFTLGMVQAEVATCRSLSAADKAWYATVVIFAPVSGPFYAGQLLYALVK